MKKLLLLSVLVLSFCLSYAQSNFIQQDTVFGKSTICTGGVEVCIDSFVYEDIGDYEFTLDGQTLTANLDPCSEAISHDYSYLVTTQGGETGPFRLDSWTINGKTFSILSYPSLIVLLDSMRKWDPLSNWQLDQAALTISGFPPAGSVYSCQKITGLSRGGTNDVCHSLGVKSKGLKINVNPGFHRLIARQLSTGMRDTITLGAACLQTEIVRQSMNIGTNRSYCISSSQLLGTPVLSTFTNFCAKTTTKVTFDSLTNFCVAYTGRASGIDTACLRVCDQYGMCDTTFLYITAEPANATHIFTDTITLGLSRQKCALNEPNGANSIINLCPTSSGREVNFTVDNTNRCITYTGAAIGVDTACIKVCNTTNNACDTTLFYITTLAAAPRGSNTIFRDTIFVDSIRTKCDFAKPTGSISTFENYCSTPAGTNVQFNLNSTTRCVSYRGLAVGANTACIRVCNADGTCDTTTFIINVRANAGQSGSRTEFRDTITAGLVRQKCDLKIPTGAINLIQNYCITSSGTNVGFNIDPTSYCVTYRGLSAGFDTACYRICGASGICDTTIFIIETKPAPNTNSRQHIFIDTITVGLTRTKSDLIIPQGAVTIENLCGPNSGTNVRFNLGSNSPFPVTYTGLLAGPDTACLRICNVSGVCDTTYMYITALVPVIVNPPKPTPSRDTIAIKVFERRKYCPSTTELGGPASVIRFCSTPLFDKINALLSTTDKCVNILGTKPGSETFCVEVCTASGICDTTTLVVNVTADTLRPRPAIDSMRISIGEIRTYCPDSTELGSGIVSNIGSCSNKVMDKASVILNNSIKCIEVTGQRAGKDTTCIVLCNLAGVCDTTTLYITVTPDTFRLTSSVERVNILVGQDSLFTKIDTAQIGGVVDTIYDACPGKNGSRARMQLSRINRNVRISGLTPGSDTMCIVVCNRSTNRCDTTTIIAIVRDSAIGGRIIANVDFDSLGQGRTKVLEVYKNDDLRNRIPTRLTIVRPPTKGTADTISFRQGLIKYTAGKSAKSCGLDSFRYRVCIDTVCTEANVNILVTCSDSLKVFTGISPNGDGRNDALVIEGLQNYPDHMVLIFNRWGNEVFKTKDYQNDWQGTWNKKDLPDGTYFYMVRNETDGSIIKSGYLQILR